MIEGRPLTFWMVAPVAVVGNEDGAHKITADDVGFTVPAQHLATLLRGSPDPPA